MAKRNHETKKEWLAKEVAKAVNAGKVNSNCKCTMKREMGLYLDL